MANWKNEIEKTIADWEIEKNRKIEIETRKKNTVKVLAFLNNETYDFVQPYYFPFQTFEEAKEFLNFFADTLINEKGYKKDMTCYYRTCKELNNDAYYIQLSIL